MRTEKRDGGDERLILAAMITDKALLAKIASQWQKPGLFASPWANTVGWWCCRYFTKYGEAPNRRIEHIFRHWAERHESSDRETVDIVSHFLVGLSDEHAEVNTDYVLDIAEVHFNTVKLRKLVADIESEIDVGDSMLGWDKLQNANKLQIGTEAAVDIFSDVGAIQKAFEVGADSIVTYGGALGEFFHDALALDSFVAFMAPEKRGKTWQLLDLAWRAALQRRRVAFFEVGDMSQNQIIRRIMVRAARHPFRAKTIKYPKSIILPIEKGDHANVKSKLKEFTSSLKWRRAWERMGEIATQTIRSSESYFRLSVHPNDSINVLGIEAVLDQWEREGWMPDVIVIDYADILAPMSGSRDERDQVNKTWKSLRALSQKRHCLVVTATQADAAAFKAETITRSNFSNDKRIFAHVTGMVGVSSTATEVDRQIRRLRWLAIRESDFPESKQVLVAGCLDVGNPCIVSRFMESR